MKTFERFARPPMLLSIGVAALSLTAAAARPPLAFANQRGHIVVPPVPSNLQAPEGNKVYLEGHAVGTQDYICMPCPNAITPAATCPASGFAWAFYGPQATLFDTDDGDDHQIHHPLPQSQPRGSGQAPSDMAGLARHEHRMGQQYLGPGAILD